MSELLTQLNLPSKQITYKELSLKHYKIILKCLIADKIDVQNLIFNLNNILSQITNLSLTEILKLNILEYLLLLIDIRITSIGSSIFAVSTINDKKLNIEVPLFKTLDEVQKCLNTYTPIYINEKALQLSFILPTVEDFLNKKDFACIKEEIDNLPVKHLKKINKHIKKYYDFFSNYYFYKAPIKKFSMPLSIKPYEYVNLVKILYNDNLNSIYENIFYLSKICYLSSEYLESCTYGEFKIFVKKAEEMLYKNNKTSSQPSHEEPHIPPIDINSLYGNDESSVNITRSEFTP